MLELEGTIVLRVVDMHTAGEPVRIVESGYPPLAGATILEKRRNAQACFDHLRRMLMLEPRGHAGMYGVIPTTPSSPDADLAVLAQKDEVGIGATGASQVDANDIGLAILAPLRELDEVAYLRFASVYQGFTSLEDFEAAITQLRVEHGSAAQQDED